jgi:hypothetical protein
MGSAKPACSRLFEVEALRDGRLAGAELARFRAHAGVCPVCAGEAETLEFLARALRSSVRGERDELHVRRERTRLLAAFDQSLVPSLRGARSRFWTAAVAVLVALSLALTLGFVFARSLLEPRSPTAAAPAAKSSEPVLIRAATDARWSRRTEQHVEKIVLESGSLSIRVQKAGPARRVIVVLPDGELEDIGTTFTVSAAGARTTRVAVEEGSVVLRLRGAQPIVLGARDSWSPSSAPSTPPRPAPSAPPSAAPNAPDAEPLPPRVMAPRAPATSVSAPVGAGEPAPRSDPSADFRSALSALNAGDHSGAARLFTAFLSNHPRDARIEDAAYLRVLACHRAEDQGATQRAAGDYLKRFPSGFRRTEVEALEASSP